MPPKRKLKVFRTPIGFHDAYIAAPSQKAALEAWGSDADLFARGIAEVVTDPALTAEPLAKPGVVIRRSRGTTAEQIAALPPSRKGNQPKGRPLVRSAKTHEPAKPRKPAPRPSRALLDKADQALSEMERRHRTERDTIAAKLSALQKERRLVEERQAREILRQNRARERAAERYEAALEKWRG